MASHLGRDPNQHAERNLRDTVDSWLIEAELPDLRLGFYGELHATPEFVPWLLTAAKDRISADQVVQDQVDLGS